MILALARQDPGLLLQSFNNNKNKGGIQWSYNNNL